VKVHVRSSFSDEPGTWITEEDVRMEQAMISGIAHDRSEAKITVVGVPDRPGIAAAIFAPLAEADIAADVIVQTAGHEGATDMSFTVPTADGKRAHQILQGVATTIGARTVLAEDGLAKVSVVGSGIRGQPGVAALMFDTLAKHGINIEMISTSEIRITCIIKAGQVAEAVRVLHDAFKL